MQLREAVLYDFGLAGRRVRLWKRPGESYEHVLMKALGFAMFVGDFPRLEIETEVGLRYKPDLVARREPEEFRRRQFLFWGECGQTSVRKIGWLVKHADVELVVLFKMIANPGGARLGAARRNRSPLPRGRAPASRQLSGRHRRARRQSQRCARARKLVHKDGRLN